MSLFSTIRKLAFVALLMAFPGPSFAQPTETTSVRSESITNDGEIVGCSIVFEGAMIDDRSNAGEVLSLDGSVRYQSFSNEGVSPGLALKVLVQVADLDAKTFTPSRPSRISLLGPQDSSLANLRRTTIPGDHEGSLLALYQPEALSSVLGRANESRDLGIAISRQVGADDLHWKVQLPLQQVLLPFADCVLSVSEKMQAELVDQ